MLATEPTIQLLLGVVGFSITGGFSLYILCHADQETERLLRLKNWARPQGNKEKYADEDRLAFHKIKRNLIVGYWVFLVISALGLLLHGAALYKRLLT